MTALGVVHPEAKGECPTGCSRRVRAGHLMCGADDFPEKREAYEQARSAALASIR